MITSELAIPREVYTARVEELCAIIEREGLTGAILADPANIAYFTGYLETVRPFERPVATVITRDGEATMILNEIGTNRIRSALERGACWITDYRLYTEHPRLTSRLPDINQWPSFVASVLKELGLHGTLGVDTTTARLQQAAEAVRASLVSIRNSIMSLRLVKDEYELAIMRAAGAVSDKAQEYYHSLLEPGRFIMEVNQEAARFLAVELANTYPDAHWKPQVSGWTGPDTAYPHGPGAHSGRRIQVGDCVINIINYPLNGYWNENERTYLIGEPSEQQRHAFVTMCEAQAAGFAEFVSGNRVADIDAATQSVIENAGLGEYINHRSSHGKGLHTHEDPIDAAYNFLKLESNMVLSCEPGIYIPDVGGFRHSDNVIVGPDGGEWLTHYPRTLDDLIVRP